MRKISAETVADLLGVTLRTLRNWEQEGQGPKKVMENRKPVYPEKSLKAWLKKHRPNVTLGGAPAPGPAEREAAREEKALAKLWDEFYADCEKDKLRRKAYTRACELDDSGDHAGADKVLLKAGVAPEIVQQRREHLNYTERLKNRPLTNVT